MDAAEAVGAVLLGLLIAALLVLEISAGPGSVIMDSIPKCTQDPFTFEVECPPADTH